MNSIFISRARRKSAELSRPVMQPVRSPAVCARVRPCPSCASNVLTSSAVPSSCDSRITAPSVMVPSTSINSTLIRAARFWSAGEIWRMPFNRDLRENSKCTLNRRRIAFAQKAHVHKRRIFLSLPAESSTPLRLFRREIQSWSPSQECSYRGRALVEIFQRLPPEAVKIFLVLFLSFLIGLEREEHKVTVGAYSFGGVRTFPLIGFIGYSLALLSGTQLLPLTFGFLAVAGFLLLSYWHKLSSMQAPGVTSEMS